MSGSRPNPAEQHLGDRLSALVDGELGHETRERVLAHVATCPKCKAEVDAQRRLKNVFAEVAPPPPSESFLARLQGLPGGDDLDGGVSPFGGGGLGGFTGGFPGRSATPGVFGVKRGGGAPFDFDYAPGRGPGHGHAAAVPVPTEQGFRIHPVSRGEAAPSRGLRFAFVAAGAVSLAAIALGGVTTGSPAATDTRAGSGSNVTPAGAPTTGAATAPESQRRRGATPLLAQSGQSTFAGTPVAPTTLSAPLLPGLSTPATLQDVARTLTTPVMAGAAAMSPLIRPLSVTAPIALTTPSPAPAVTTPGVLSLSATGGPASPSPSPSATSSP
ncbi:zf-HC2 domain-containing protein [Streptomyces sp. NPDC028635]|uniref:anti-sigma factor family protein n=1 Tax=Streptomyces sp. NPDC028635 TaxID=3154800 RepID=UPI0033F8BC7E